MVSKSAPRTFPESTIDAVSRCGKNASQSPRQSHRPFCPPLLPLRNPIHALFRPDRFPKLAPHLYETLAPTLRLATKFLTAESMLEWWLPLFLSPLPPPPPPPPSQHSTAGRAKGKGKGKSKAANRLPPQTPATLAAVPVTEESLRRTESLLTAHADSVEFRFATESEEDVAAAAGAGTMDGAFASTREDLRPGKEGKAVVLLGEGWWEGLVEEWRRRDGGRIRKEKRARIEDKKTKAGSEDSKVRVAEKEARVVDKTEEEDEEDGRKLRVQVALAILLVHELAHSVWVVRNATVACTTATTATLPSAPHQIPPEPYHNASESEAELGCSWEAFALSGGRIQPINLSPRCDDGLCWFAWPERHTLKRRPRLLVPPDRDMDPRYNGASDRERADRSSEKEVTAAKSERERSKERFWGVSMGWVREVCDRDKWAWVELFGKQDLRVRFVGEEGDGAGATCPFSQNGWREKQRKEEEKGGQGQSLGSKRTAVLYP